MKTDNPILKGIIITLAVVGLGMTLIPSILHFSGRISSEQVNLWMAIGMVIWFITGSIWLGGKKGEIENPPDLTE